MRKIFTDLVIYFISFIKELSLYHHKLMGKTEEITKKYLLTDDYMSIRQN